MAQSKIDINVLTIHHIQNDKTTSKDIERTPDSGGHNKRQVEAFLDSLNTTTSSDPTKSMSRLSNEPKIDPKTVNGAVHDDLGMKSYVRVPRHLLTTTLMKKRLARCIKIRN